MYIPQIYEKHLKNTTMLMFRSILNHAEKNGDAACVSSLMQVLQGHPGISSQAKGLVYNTWIDILCKCYLRYYRN